MLPNDGKAFNAAYEQQGGYWLDAIDVVTAEGNIRPAATVLVWQDRLYVSDDPQANSLTATSPEARAAAATLPRYCGKGHLLMPGFVNSHTHLAMSLFKDLASLSASNGQSQNQSPKSNQSHSLGRNQGQLSLVENLFFQVEEYLTPDIIAGLCYPSILEALHSGTTALVDSYFFSDQVASAMSTLKVRGFVSEHFADLGGPHQKGLDDWPSYQSRLTDQCDDRLGRIVYAHATDTVSRPLLTELAAFAREQGIKFHMHLAQTFGETVRTKAHAGLAPIPYAIDCGAVSADSLLVHLVDCGAEDLARLIPHQPTIAICPVSEVLYETLPDLPLLIDSGLPILLGTDCPASNDGFDMAEELRAMALLYKLQSGRFLPAGKALDQVWGHAYRFWFDQEPLADGSFADFSLVAKNASLLPIHDMASHIVYSHITRHIEAVFVGGTLLSRHGSYVAGDASALQQTYERSIVAIERMLWDKFKFASAGTKLTGFTI